MRRSTTPRRSSLPNRAGREDRPDEGERALLHLRRASAGGIEEANAQYLIGRILADRGELQAAVAALRRSIELNPQQLDAHYRLAQAQARLGEQEASRATMKRFTELQRQADASEAADKRLKTLRNAVLAALAEDDLGAAQTRIEELLEATPGDPDALTLAAKVWSSVGDIGAAVAATARALQAQPAHWEALYLHGLLLHMGGRSRDAHSYLQRSLQANPLFADAHAVLGNVLMTLGDPGAAAESYRAAVRLDANNPSYQLNLATAYGRLGMQELEAESMAVYRRLLTRREQSER